MNRIEAALAAATDTKEFVVGPGVIGQVPSLFKKRLGGRALVVADPETWAAAGERVQALLVSAGVETAEPLLFGRRPHPTDVHSATVRDRLLATGASAVSVGSGSINDICKYGSELAGRRYLCVATAASVDGYASYGAAMQMEGFKCTMPCAAPLVIVADTDIVRTAPRAMTASGYGDLMAKKTGGDDWIIADAVGAHPIRPDIWEMVQTPLDGWLDSPGRLFTDDTRLAALFEGLTVCGFSMQAMHDSRPVSGAEHLFSHVWEMYGIRGPSGEEASHGEKVGIGTVWSAKLAERVLSRPLTPEDVGAAVASWPTWEERERTVRDAFAGLPPRVAEGAVAACRAKYLPAEALKARLEALSASWEGLAERVRAHHLPSGEIIARLKAVGGLSTPEEIGVRTADMTHWARKAQLIRNRYTILDLAFETGRLDFGRESV